MKETTRNTKINLPKDSDHPPQLIAYQVSENGIMPLVRAPASRAWMQATDQHFAKRCLPLLIANQSGWFILCSHTFRVIWDGGTSPSSLRILYLTGDPPYPATSMFGYGILTFIIPYLFRTPPGYNVLARGPANLPKDAISPLEGIVETDWAVATFTMNWQITRPHQMITFEEGEPICMIVPQQRGELESFRPCVAEIGSEPELDQAFHEWAYSRHQFQTRLKMRRSRKGEALWQKHYFKGTSPGGQNASQHQTRLNLRDFKANLEK